MNWLLPFRSSIRVLEKLFEAYAVVAGIGKSHFHVIHDNVFVEVFGGLGRFGANTLDGFFDLSFYAFICIAVTHLHAGKIKPKPSRV